MILKLTTGVRDQKAAGSNPATSTTKKAPLEGAFFCGYRCEGFGHAACKVVGEREKRCPGGAIAAGDSASSESAETSGAPGRGSRAD